MTWSFKPGDKVVCVDDSTRPGTIWYGDAPEVGKIYTIKRVFFDVADSPVLSFLEIERSYRSKAEHGDNIGYGVRRFRPVQTKKTDISIFTDMLTSSKVNA